MSRAIKRRDSKEGTTHILSKKSGDGIQYSGEACGDNNNDNSCGHSSLPHASGASPECLHSTLCPQDYQQHVTLMCQLKNLLSCVEGDTLTLHQQAACGLSETSIEIELGYFSELARKIDQLCQQEEGYLQRVTCGAAG